MADERRLAGRVGGAMYGEKEPATGGPNDALNDALNDADGDSFDEARVEPIAVDDLKHPDARGNVPAPGWMKRLSPRGKLARALIVAVAVIVALVVLLPRPALTLPPQITRLLTPAPTQTSMPGRFIADQFEQVPMPPVPGAMTTFITPSPRDTNTAFTCATPTQPDAASGPVSGEVSLWVTHDVGQTWSRVALPTTVGTYCDLASAGDGSRRLTLTVANYSLDQPAPPCAHSRYFLSEDDGATWRALQHTTLAPPDYADGFCNLWATARHLFMTSYFDRSNDQNGSSQSVSFLERSDDDGRTWQRADEGLPDGAGRGYAQPLDATGETLVTLDTRYDAGALIQSDVWMSADAGASWRRAESARFPTPPRGSGPIGGFITEAHLGALAGAPQACHCVFGVSWPNGFAREIIGQHLYLSHDLSRWTPLPPIPVKGTSAERSGVYQLLGLTGDGRLLVLGADPEDGVPALPDHNGQISGRDPALWAWNTHTGRWELAHSHVPCENLQSCVLYSTGVSYAAKASGEPVGTFLWVVIESGFAENGQSISSFYRLYIPAS
jgi:hypothetical protein